MFKTLHWEKDNKQPFTTLFPHVSGEYRDDESELLKLLEHKVFSHWLRMDREDHGGLSKTITNAHNVLKEKAYLWEQQRAKMVIDGTQKTQTIFIDKTNNTF